MLEESLPASAPIAPLPLLRLTADMQITMVLYLQENRMQMTASRRSAELTA